MGNSKINIGRIAIVAAVALVLFGLWCLAVYVTYQDRQRILNEVTIRAGFVHYATPSDAPLLPMRSSAPIRHSLPVVSGNTVRQLAHSGHATMPPANTSKPVIYATSSASVHSLGSGGAADGFSSADMGSSTSSSSARGIRYSTTSVAMPSALLAVNIRSAYAASSGLEAEGSLAMMGGPRRVMPTYNGEDGDWINGGSGDWWYYDEDHWRNPYDGETRYDPTLGYTVVWNGAFWEKLTEYDPGVPVGGIPWALFLLLSALFLVLRFRRLYRRSSPRFRN